MALRIEQYAVVGDTGTVALDRAGRLGRLAVPAAVRLGGLLRCAARRARARALADRPRRRGTVDRRYVGDSFVLETTHETETGVVKVTDLMPVADDRADLVRRIEGVSGTVTMRHEWIVRFGYGKIRPWVSRGKDDDGKADHHGDRRARQARAPRDPTAQGHATGRTSTSSTCRQGSR